MPLPFSSVASSRRGLRHQRPQQDDDHTMRHHDSNKTRKYSRGSRWGLGVGRRTLSSSSSFLSSDSGDNNRPHRRRRHTSNMMRRMSSYSSSQQYCALLDDGDDDDEEVGYDSTVQNEVDEEKKNRDDHAEGALQHQREQRNVMRPVSIMSANHSSNSPPTPTPPTTIKGNRKRLMRRYLNHSYWRPLQQGKQRSHHQQHHHRRRHRQHETAKKNMKLSTTVRPLSIKKEGGLLMDHRDAPSRRNDDDAKTRFFGDHDGAFPAFPVTAPTTATTQQQMDYDDVIEPFTLFPEEEKKIMIGHEEKLSSEEEDSIIRTPSLSVLPAPSLATTGEDDPIVASACVVSSDSDKNTFEPIDEKIVEAMWTHIDEPLFFPEENDTRDDDDNSTSSYSCSSSATAVSTDTAMTPDTYSSSINERSSHSRQHDDVFLPDDWILTEQLKDCNSIASSVASSADSTYYPNKQSPSSSTTMEQQQSLSILKNKIDDIMSHLLQQHQRAQQSTINNQPEEPSEQQHATVIREDVVVSAATRKNKNHREPAPRNNHDDSPDDNETNVNVRLADDATTFRDTKAVGDMVDEEQFQCGGEVSPPDGDDVVDEVNPLHDDSILHNVDNTTLPDSTHGEAAESSEVALEEEDNVNRDNCNNSVPDNQRKGENATQPEEPQTTHKQKSIDEAKKKKKKVMRWSDEVQDSNRPLEQVHSYDHSPELPVSIRLVVLLMHAQKFEFILTEFDTDERLLIKHVLEQLPKMANNPVLRRQKYHALCLNDKELIHITSLQDYHLREGCILVAVPTVKTKKDHKHRSPKSTKNNTKQVLKQASCLLTNRILRRALRKAKLSGRALQPLMSSQKWVAHRRQQKEGLESDAPNNVPVCSETDTSETESSEEEVDVGEASDVASNITTSTTLPTEVLRALSDRDIRDDEESPLVTGEEHVDAAQIIAWDDNRIKENEETSGLKQKDEHEDTQVLASERQQQERELDGEPIIDTRSLHFQERGQLSVQQ